MKMAGLILGITASLALAYIGVRELKNIRKDMKKIRKHHSIEDVLIPLGDPIPRKRDNTVKQPKKKTLNRNR